MAIIRPGAIIGAISGNLGGVCFIAGKGAPVARQRIHKKNSQTPKQISHRAGTLFLSQSWRTLTPAQRIMWNTAATKFPVTNRLGITSFASGFSLFLKVNAISRYAFALWSNIPPDGPETIPPHVITFTASTSGNIRFTFAPSITLVYFAKIFASRPFSDVVPKHIPNKRLMAVSTGIPPNVVDVTAAFHESFGIPTPGEIVLATVSIFTPGWPPQPAVTLSATVTP